MPSVPASMKSKTSCLWQVRILRVHDDKVEASGKVFVGVPFTGSP